VPNLLGVVVVYATLSVPQVILSKSFLSFLGLGVQEPATSLGALVSDGAHAMETRPGRGGPSTFLAVTLLCLQFPRRCSQRCPRPQGVLSGMTTQPSIPAMDWRGPSDKDVFVHG